MSQPVKLSDDLVLYARTTAAETERSIAGQIEFWAQLGKGLEPILRGDTAIALHRSGKERKISDAIGEVDSSKGRQKVREYINNKPFPHFEPAPDSPNLLIKIDEDGTRTKGRFVNRVFKTEAKKRQTR